MNFNIVHIGFGVCAGIILAYASTATWLVYSKYTYRQQRKMWNAALKRIYNPKPRFHPYSKAKKYVKIRNISHRSKAVMLKEIRI